jgi:hypothetical protein
LGFVQKPYFSINTSKHNALCIFAQNGHVGGEEWRNRMCIKEGDGIVFGCLLALFTEGEER